MQYYTFQINETYSYARIVNTDILIASIVWYKAGNYYCTHTMRNGYTNENWSGQFETYNSAKASLIVRLKKDGYELLSEKLEILI